ncbi:FAD-binding protein [Legionella sp.]|uniref:FAD-binding oxidoreductase n=1 Tax=Legionella sp. TaxID=459 RepID=UPI003C860DC7
MVTISSWGRLESSKHDVLSLTNRNDVSRMLHNNKPGLAYGMGRSYGDVCLNPGGILWKTTGLNHFISFDEYSGRLVCEAGILLHDIHKLVIPRGWMLPVTPGTQFVTVGGAIANDVHGKNHHVFGTFGNHIHKIKLLRTNGEVLECGPQQQKEWFAATVGGLGLTGVILTAEIQLRPIKSPWLTTEIIPYANLDELFKLTDNSQDYWEYTVSWMDCSLRRGIFMRANHTDYCDLDKPYKRSMTVPIISPFSLMNKFTLNLFNRAYFNIKKRQFGHSIKHYQSFLYPLDTLLEWNRIYGPKGFYQYQSMVPYSVGINATQAMLKEIGRSYSGSFLALLKTFGNQNSAGMLSFPQPGVTLAVDFPNKGLKTLKLFERLDAIVQEAGGRIYPAKDARMPSNLFELGYPRLSEFLLYRDPGISSAMSRRLMGQ